MTEADDPAGLPEEAMELLAEYWSGESELSEEQIRQRLSNLGVEPQELEEIDGLCRALDYQGLREEAWSAPAPDWASRVDAARPADGARSAAEAPPSKPPSQPQILRVALPLLAAAAAVLLLVNRPGNGE
ncbi:MAG: hypothetical protein AAGG01_03760, partial [Planctomycetota bacterium]